MPKEYPNFESLISSFLVKLDLATKSDVQSLMERIDHLEQIIESIAKMSNNKPIHKTKAGQSQRVSDQVLEILGKNKVPMTYTELKEISSLDEKSLRNVIYRLNKLGRIETVKRGQYIISNQQDNNHNDS
jgi:hypothetical protein